MDPCLLSVVLFCFVFRESVRMRGDGGQRERERERERETLNPAQHSAQSPIQGSVSQP